jgi:hypothetical protein
MALLLTESRHLGASRMRCPSERYLVQCQFALN